MWTSNAIAHYNYSLYFQKPTEFINGRTTESETDPSKQPAISIWQALKIPVSTPTLTLIYPTHFEDVQCQSAVNYIYEG